MERSAIVDSHLDLAENVTLFGRGLTLRAAEIRRVEKRSTRQATVSLPDLERGGIAVAFATVTAGQPPGNSANYPGEGAIRLSEVSANP